jgi:hypothetical protein
VIDQSKAVVGINIIETLALDLAAVVVAIRENGELAVRDGRLITKNEDAQVDVAADILRDARLMGERCGLGNIILAAAEMLE